MKKDIIRKIFTFIFVFTPIIVVHTVTGLTVENCWYINQFTCVGCEFCAAICPDIIEMNEYLDFAQFKTGECGFTSPPGINSFLFNACDEECLRDAEEECPVSALMEWGGD